MDVIKTIVKEGAFNNDQDNRGRSPLHYAAENGNVDLSLFLYRFVKCFLLFRKNEFENIFKFSFF